ncbi:MAG: OTU domain-containing protein [Bacteroidales bacterium]
MEEALKPKKKEVKQDTQIVKEDIQPEDDYEIIEKKIRLYDKSDFIVKETLGDGNCAYRAICKSLGQREDIYVELKRIAADYIRRNDMDINFILARGAQDKEDFANKVESNGYHAGNEELYALANDQNLLVAIYRKTKKDWIFIKTHDDINVNKPRLIAFLEYSENSVSET